MRQPVFLCDGEQMSLSKIARRKGIPSRIIWDRYQRGVRGEQLWEKTKLSETLDDDDTAEESDIGVKKRRLSLQQQREERARKIREEHAKAFARPFIDASLLTEKERNEIRGSVVGRQRWYLGDA